MAIHMGIMCERCRKVHFVATSHGIRMKETKERMYLLRCEPPCTEVKEFRREGMRPYRVSEEIFKSGYAQEGKYELVQAGGNVGGGKC